jgi:hypothetical protein
MEKSPPWLTVDWVWSQFAQSRNTAATHYRRFVREGVGHPSIWKDVQGQALLGAPDFVESLRGYLRGSETVKEIPRRQRYMGRPTLPQVFAGKLSRARRDALMVQAVERHGYSQKEGADVVGLHYSTVSLNLVSTKPGPAQPDPIHGVVKSRGPRSAGDTDVRCSVRPMVGTERVSASSVAERKGEPAGRWQERRQLRVA